MLSFIWRIFLAIFSPGLFAKIKIAIAAVNVVKDALASNKLDDLVNATKTPVDNDILFWARRVLQYLYDWRRLDQVYEMDMPKDSRNELALLSNGFKVSSPPVKNAIYLRLAVQAVQDMTLDPADKSVTLPEDRAIIFVQTVYSQQKQKNEK